MSFVERWRHPRRVSWRKPDGSGRRWWWNEDEQEETPKRPTKNEVRQAIRTLAHYSLFAVEVAKNWWQTSQLSFTIDKSIRKNRKTTEHSKIFQCNTICWFIPHIITVFLYNQVSFFIVLYFIKKWFIVTNYMLPRLFWNPTHYCQLFPFLLGLPNSRI